MRNFLEFLGRNCTTCLIIIFIFTIITFHIVLNIL